MAAITPPRHGLVLACLLAAPTAGQTGNLVLTDVSTAAGVGWVQVDGAVQIGAGCGFLDYDQDGWLDLVVTGGLSPPVLFRNRQNGTFAVGPSNQFFGLSSPVQLVGDYACCVAVGDYDNDGDPDLFFGRWGENRLYRNDGGGTFVDVTTPEVEGLPTAYTTTAAFGDYNRDGNLDLFVGNYTRVVSFPFHTPEPNVLLEGNGDGTFQDVTTPAWAGAGTALASTWTDYDDDGDVDLMCANDFGEFVEPNRVYRNDGFGAFTEVSGPLGLDLAIFCMGIAVGDIDRDGDLDYYFTNLGRNALMRNDGAGAPFVDITAAAGVELTQDPATFPPLLAASWGTGFHDFDSDGWLDLYVSNGYIPATSFIANGLATANTLFQHDGASMTFSSAAALDTGQGRGVAFGDYDNDGDLDVLQANVAGPLLLLRNDTPRPADGAHWLRVNLSGRISNRDAIGARLDVEVEDFTAIRELRRNDSLASSSDPRVHFGLGTANTVRKLAIRWPSGVEQQLHGLDVDRQVDVVEPLVTVELPRIEAFDVPGLGRAVVFQAWLVNHAASTTEVAFAPQVRSVSNSGATTATWTGPGSLMSLVAHGAQQIFDVHVLPLGTTIPASLGLEHFWLCMDAGSGLDEGRSVVVIP